MIDQIREIYKHGFGGFNSDVVVTQYSTNNDRYSVRCIEKRKIAMFRQVCNEIFCNGEYAKPNDKKVFVDRYSFDVKPSQDLTDYIANGLHKEHHEPVIGNFIEATEVCDTITREHKPEELYYNRDCDSNDEMAITISDFVVVIDRTTWYNLAGEHDFHAYFENIDLAHELWDYCFNPVEVYGNIHEVSFEPIRVYKIQDGYYHIHIKIQESK